MFVDLPIAKWHRTIFRFAFAPGMARFVSHDIDAFGRTSLHILGARRIALEGK